MIYEFLKRYKTFKNWWRFVPPFNRQRFNVVAQLRNGPKILIKDLRSVDYATVVAIGGGDSYHLSEIKNPSVIVDVGAHIGIFSLIVAQHFPKATVYAIEPDPNNYEQLLQNIILNKLSNIIPLKVAVSADYGSTTLFQSQSSVSHSIVESVGEGVPIKVETIPLSKFTKIDALKFDAEGAEYLIKDIPAVAYIAIEVHKFPGMDMQGLIKKLRTQFNIIKEDTEKTGHVTLVGIGLN
jgi:FkbM family methyltransferase